MFAVREHAGETVRVQGFGERHWERGAVSVVPDRRARTMVRGVTIDKKRVKETERMAKTEHRLRTLVLGPQDYRLREPLDVLGEPGLLDGELTWQVDGQRFNDGAGASAFVPRGTATPSRTSGTKQHTS
jgi:hypothetical protein